MFKNRLKLLPFVTPQLSLVESLVPLGCVIHACMRVCACVHKSRKKKGIDFFLGICSLH